MNPTILLSFLGTSVVFGLIPGPSVCFTIAHTFNHGVRLTIPTILGQLTANCTQIIIVLFGLSTILSQSIFLFSGLKIGGALYLIYLGCRQWFALRPSMDIQSKTNTRTRRKAFLDGFLVCGTNPKAIFYYAALLPQFVVPSGNTSIQILIMACSSILIAALVLLFYTMLANTIRNWFKSKKFWKTQNRLSGCLLIGAGITLAMTSKK